METEHCYTARDGARLGYRLWRRGTGAAALVMLHGLASNLSRWSELVETLELDPPRDLLRLDLRGHGSSMYRGPIGHAVWSEDLHALLSHEKYRRAVLLGHSLGAQTALHFARRHPGTTAGVIMIDPLLPECLQGNLARVARLRFLLPPLIRLTWWVNALGIRREEFPVLDLQQLDRQTRQLLRDRPETRIEQIYARPLRDLKNLPLANYLQDLYEVTRPLPPLTAIRVPVLVLLSRGVSLSKLSETRQRLAQLPDVGIRTIDADHWMLTERPDETRLAIQDWCNRLEVDSQ